MPGVGLKGLLTGKMSRKSKSHSPAGRKHLKRKRKKPIEMVSLRTKGVRDKLRRSGLSESEIKQLTGR
jgi:hypothetical protein